MNARSWFSFVPSLLLAASAASAQNDEWHGSRLGSVAIGANGGITYVSALKDVPGLGSTHPTVGGWVSVGLHRYFGLFVQAGYSPLANASGSYCAYGVCAGVSANANIIHVAAGLEAVGSNRSRVVPYGRVGWGYGRGAASTSVNILNQGWVGASISQGAPAIAFGGGIRTYLTEHFGLSGGLDAYRTVGNYGGNTFLMPVGGVFAQFN
jgi:hypothetical protein